MLDRVLTSALVLPFALAAATSPSERSEVLFTFADPQIVESSGLAAVGGLVVTHNDSGDSGRVFTVDPATGDTVGTTLWSATAEDLEAVAPAGPDSVWVADIGDNGEARESISIAEVPVGRGDRTVEAESYELTYPDGAHDAETLLVHPSDGRLYLVTKEILGSTLYALPERLSADRPNQLERVGPPGLLLPLATDGVFFPDGRHVIVRSYAVATVYAFPSLTEVALLGLPSQQLGEGVAIDHRRRVLLSSEGVHSEVLHLRLPGELRDVVWGTGADAAPAPTDASTDAPSDPPGAAGGEQPAADTDRRVWPWLLTGIVGALAVVVLLRSLRPR